jgi:hypothetical protein
MKTMRINDHLSLEIHDGGQEYEVRIDNETKKVVYHSSEFSPIKLDDIQQLVDKLMRLKMISLIGDGITTVSIYIWEIDETDDLYIETFHFDEDLSESDRVMKYDEFLNM